MAFSLTTFFPLNPLFPFIVVLDCKGGIKDNGMNCKIFYYYFYEKFFSFCVKLFLGGSEYGIEWDVSKLTASQKRIADFIEKSGEHILYYSETELAQRLHVSNATISRFWKRLAMITSNHLKQQ